MENINLSSSNLTLLNLIEKGIAHFLFALLAYVHDTL